MSDIEAGSVSFLIETLSKSDIIDAKYLKMGDREPIWDGSIWLYNNHERSLNNIKGRIFVQIKGKEINGISDFNKKYSLTLCELENYCKAGGTIFFLVTIDKNSKKKKIYYSSFLPYDLNILIKNNLKSNKTITFDLKVFPDKVEEFDCLILNFFENTERQKNANVNFNIKNFANFNIKNFLVDYHSPKTSKMKHNPNDYIKKNDLYIYYEDNNIIYTVGKIKKFIFNKNQVINQKVLVNDILYFSNYRILNKKKKSKIFLGNSISIELVEKGGEKPKIEFTYKGSLNERIQDTTFFIELLKFQIIDFVEFKFPIKVEGDWIEEKLKELSILLEKYLEIKFFLNSNNVFKDLYLDKLSDYDINYIFNFVEKYKKNEIQFVDNEFDLQFFTPKFGNIRILFMCLKNGKGSFEIKNFFKNDFHLYADVDDVFIEYSHLLLLKKNDILSYDNIDYNFIFENIISKGKNEKYFEVVNLFILELLLAYDENKGIDKELLKLSKKLIQWLIDNNEWSNFNILFEINLMQIFKRENSLDDEKRFKLSQIIINNPKNYSILTACNILLEETYFAKEHFKKLSKEDQEKFRSYPIYNLFKF